MAKRHRAGPVALNLALPVEKRHRASPAGGNKSPCRATYDSRDRWLQNPLQQFAKVLKPTMPEDTPIVDAKSSSQTMPKERTGPAQDVKRVGSVRGNAGTPFRDSNLRLPVALLGGSIHRLIIHVGVSTRL